MANRMTKKEYDEIKNSTVTILVFDGDRRVFTEGGRNYKNALETVVYRTALGRDAYVVEMPFTVGGVNQGLSSFSKKQFKATILAKRIEESYLGDDDLTLISVRPVSYGFRIFKMGKEQNSPREFETREEARAAAWETCDAVIRT